MKQALVVQHMDHDHAGRFLDWFAEDGILPTSLRLFEGADLPSLARFDLLFVLGGAQNTWEEEEHAWLKAEKAMIREWVVDRAKPYLGICLGHQLLATALGGEVAPARAREVGLYDVALTEDGRSHRNFAGLPERFKVMQWHGAEVKRPPEGAQVLASSETTAIQALALDGHALSTQFHCEFTPQTVEGWSSLPSYIASLEKEKGAGAYQALKRSCYPAMPEIARQTRQVWDNFKKNSGLIS
jgi:GMP synthase-like glutamine amidotransferase